VKNTLAAMSSSTTGEEIRVAKADNGAKRLECVELAPAFRRDKSSGKPEHSKRFAQLDERLDQ
jgi:hypothetical protein